MGGSALKIAGCAFIVVGVILAFNPELVSNKPIPSDTFEAVERRVTWGKLIGLGLVPLFHFRVRPWLPTLAATLSSLVVGYLVARLIGIALDGSVVRQWLYVGVEAVLLVPLVWWYIRVRTDRYSRPDR